MAFIEGEFFSDSRMNLTVYEMLTIDFLTVNLMQNLEGSSSAIREGT
jgi:hypothetical protein